MVMSKKAQIKKWLNSFLNRPVATFLVGALVGLAFFAWFYGLDIINPTYCDWIWQPITHDTAQHQLGWEFLRQDSDGLMINGLAYPVGLSAVFMDVIPLFAIIFKPFTDWLPGNFQYFGIWGILCYVLMGGLSAIIIRRIWQRTIGRPANKSQLLLQYLFTLAGSAIFVLSPTVMARSFYHPALAGQWIILLGFIVIIDTLKFKRWPSVMSVWALILVLAVLIHPYFLPMMGVLMIISIVRYWPKFTGQTIYRRLAKAILSIVIPSVLCLVVFGLNGGFTQGTGSEVHDLEEKGFNLLSFVNPMGYSIIPAFPNRSGSPETMMWLGLGVITMLVVAAWLWRGHYRTSWRQLRRIWQKHACQYWCMLIACLCLMIFALGTRIDAGPITLLQYSVPDKIYEVWSAFRAAAREAWPFYYAVMLGSTYWLLSSLKYYTKKSHVWLKSLPTIATVAICAIAIIQSVDILNSPNARAKHAGFTNIQGQTASFQPLNLSEIYDGQSHLAALDSGFRGDQSGTYIIGRTALRYDMTLNTGFFARVPDAIDDEQASWRDRLVTGDVPDDELTDYLFFTKDPNLAAQLDEHYELKQIDDYYFVIDRHS